jgi:rSAM/selenodomain-associated transferase 1
MRQHTHCAVLIFAKTPQPGKVKTRLIPMLGEAGATRLYRRLLRREVAWIAEETSYAIELWVTPYKEDPLLQELVQRYGTSISLQQGQDLGARMAHAAREALGRYRSVVLLGVDCPALSPAHLKQACHWLEQGSNAVLGPAQDGGYVLLALNRFHPALFHGHSWGGDDVATTTRQTLYRIGWQWRELPLLWDLDRPDDLKRLHRLGFEMPHG